MISRGRPPNASVCGVAKDYEWRLPPTSESISRLLNFTDAVAAIAVTLLVLPLLEIEPPESGETVWDVIGDHWGTLLAFLLSFVITLSFWRRHHRTLDGLSSFTPVLMFLNGAWLLGLVFLQFPTEMLGRSQASSGAPVLYIATLATLSWLNIAMAVYLRNHSDLVPLERQVAPRQVWWVAVTAMYLTALALLAIVVPHVALWGLVGLAVISWIEFFSRQRRPPTAPQSVAS